MSTTSVEHVLISYPENRTFKIKDLKSKDEVRRGIFPAGNGLLKIQVRYKAQGGEGDSLEETINLSRPYIPFLYIDLKDSGIQIRKIKK